MSWNLLSIVDFRTVLYHRMPVSENAGFHPLYCYPTETDTVYGQK